MTKFSNVIVRRPAKSMVEGITSAPELGKPDYEKALKQHDDYIAALKECGVEVTVLPALEQFPDSCFVEDPAVITRCGAIITNPGADSRNGEKDEIEPRGRGVRRELHLGERHRHRARGLSHRAEGRARRRLRDDHRRYVRVPQAGRRPELPVAALLTWGLFVAAA